MYTRDDVLSVIQNFRGKTINVWVGSHGAQNHYVAALDTEAQGFRLHLRASTGGLSQIVILPENVRMLGKDMIFLVDRQGQEISLTLPN